MFVFLVIVLVSNVFLVFGGLMSSIFLGIRVFMVVNFLGFFSNFMIFMKFCFVLFILVMLLNVMLVFGFIWNLVFDWLKVSGKFGLLGLFIFLEDRFESSKGFLIKMSGKVKCLIKLNKKELEFFWVLWAVKLMFFFLNFWSSFWLSFGSCMRIFCIRLFNFGEMVLIIVMVLFLNKFIFVIRFLFSYF